jgi:hypothetical protein
MTSTGARSGKHKRRDTEAGADTIETWAKDWADGETAAREGRPSEKNIEACDRLLVLLREHHPEQLARPRSTRA